VILPCSNDGRCQVTLKTIQAVRVLGDKSPHIFFRPGFGNLRSADILVSGKVHVSGLDDFTHFSSKWAHWGHMPAVMISFRLWQRVS
jgi:hypothetical protein